AIALRLRQHLTLTPQVQQALKLLQMSALEFQQEMDQALAANPFLEDGAEASAGGDGKDEPRLEPEPDLRLPQEQIGSSGNGIDRDQEDWGGISDTEPTLQEHLREQLMISPMGERD